VFENFRDVCLENYGLDPTWYYTSHGLSWDAMLKCTKIKLELLRDHDMLLFIKQGIRGGISMSQIDMRKQTTDAWVKRSIKANPLHTLCHYVKQPLRLGNVTKITNRRI